MLRGESILNPNRKEDGNPDGGTLLPLPSDEQFRKLFDETVRDAYAVSPEARSGHFQAAKAIYAALSVDAGDRDTSLLDRDRWKQSIDMATGGMTDYNGRRIPLPYGVTHDQFRDGLLRRLESLAYSGRINERWGKFGALQLDTNFSPDQAFSRLRSLPLLPVGEGRYALVVGEALLVDAEGKVVEIDFSVSAPFRPSGGLRLSTDEPTTAELAAAQKPLTGRAIPDKRPLKLAKP